MALMRATRSHVLLLFAGTLIAAFPFSPGAAAEQAQSDQGGIVQTRGGALYLSPDAEPAPRVAGDWERFGLWDSPKTEADGQFESVQVQYQSTVPIGTEGLVAVRASPDGQRWSEWEWDVANGQVITFVGPQRWIQHRVVLLGQADRTPMVSEVQLTPHPLRGSSQAPAARAAGIAPTYRLRITRMGMVGARTANGHIVKPRDFMVALPSWKSLSSRGGSEYMVRLSANGKSVVVRVADVGPWNAHDNYWDAKREKYRDLPVGWPQDHAAFYENYNKRRAEKGWVGYPTAVDVGDGAYWALGLKGAQATADVTFLWLGEDPGPNPEPLNSRPSRRPKAVDP